MIYTSYSLLVAMFLALAPERDLLRIDFGGSDPFGATGVAEAFGRIERSDGVARFGAGSRIVSRDSIDGDLVIDLDLRFSPDGGDVTFAFGNGALLCRMVQGSEPSVEIRSGDQSSRLVDGLPDDLHWHVRIRNRGAVADLSVNGDTPVEWVGTRPFSGGKIELAVGGGEVDVDLLSVRRLPWTDGVRRSDGDGTGEGPDVMSLRELPRARYRLVDPAPTLIDPVYRIEVLDDQGAPESSFQVTHSGFRADDGIPLLDQGLAVADIRPYLHWRFLDADGEPEQVLEFTRGEVVVLKNPPGVIEVVALTAPDGTWPALTVLDVTNDRILDRCVPSGSARRPAWTRIPDDCDELKIELFLPGRDKFEETIRVTRP